MSRPQPGLATRAIHGEPHPKPVGAPVVAPIYQSTTFANAPGGTPEGVLYTRYGNTPNQLAIGERLAALEGAEGALFLGSGMGATAMAHLAVLHPGDHLLSSNWIYGGTRRLFNEEFHRLGIDVSYVTPSDPRNWRRQLKKNTRAVFVEIVTNPLMRVVDIDYLATFCRELGISLLVDSTFATPVNCRPLEHGADVIIHSATKYLNGHSDVIAGAVVGDQPIVDEVRRLMTLWGPAIDPHQAWLVERGLKTLTIRMERHNANGLAFARWAVDHPAVAEVWYPGLEHHPDHEVAVQLLDGFGGMVALRLKAGAAAVQTVLKHLELVTHAPSLGGPESLVSVPRFTSHTGMSEAELDDQGVTDDLLRVSVGIEDVQDIIADFEAAFAQLRS